MRIPLLLAALLAAAHVPAAAQAPSIATLAWMAGCWQRQSPTTTVDEQWMAPAGGMMLGMGRSVRDGRVADYEMMRIEEREGALLFIATPAGQETAEFRAAAATPQEVIFRNPEHDFPTAVGYRAGADSLHAWIEGPANGTMRRIDFPMRRVPCAGAEGGAR